MLLLSSYQLYLMNATTILSERSLMGTSEIFASHEITVYYEYINPADKTTIRDWINSQIVDDDTSSKQWEKNQTK